MASGEIRAAAGSVTARAYQMLWDCRFCGTERLLGITHRLLTAGCPDPAWRYFPAEGTRSPSRTIPTWARTNLPSLPAQQCRQPVLLGMRRGSGDWPGRPNRAARGSAPARGRRTPAATWSGPVQRRDGAHRTAEPSRPVFLGLHKQHLWIIAGLILVGLVIAGIVYAVSYRNRHGQVAHDLGALRRHPASSRVAPAARPARRRHSLKRTERQRGTRKWPSVTRNAAMWTRATTFRVCRP